MSVTKDQSVEDLFRAYFSVWDTEERVRQESWGNFMMEHLYLFAHDSGRFATLADIVEVGLHEIIAVASDNPDLQKHIEDLVHQGVPVDVRGRCWRLFVDLSLMRRPGYYESLWKAALGDLADKESLEPEAIKQHFAEDGHLSDDGVLDEELTSAWRKSGRTLLQQIEKDLPRTLPGNATMLEGGKLALRRVLAAFALHYHHIGYCQGMNFIAAVLLNHWSEEDAYWGLVAIVNDVLKGYYAQDMLAIQVDQVVLKALVAQEMPDLGAHFEAVGADLACVCSQWFLCAYVNFLPIETCMRVWDMWLYQKSVAALFQVALALFHMYAPALMATTDLLDALTVLQSLAKLTYDQSGLIHVATTRFAHVTDSLLDEMREPAEAQVRAEKQELLAAADRAEAMRVARQQAAAAAAAAEAATSKVSVVKKLLARLDKKKEDKGGKVGGSEAGSRGGAGSDADESGEVERTSRAGVMSGSTAAGAAKGGARGLAPSMSSQLLGDRCNSLGGEEGSVEDAAGTYEPPTAPLFPEVPELISLSPTETSAIPDIDDFLRGGSMRRAHSRQDSGSGLTGRGKEGGDGASQQPQTPVDVKPNPRLQHINKMLWHETPKWTSLSEFSAAQRGQEAVHSAQSQAKLQLALQAVAEAGDVGGGSSANSSAEGSTAVAAASALLSGVTQAGDGKAQGSTAATLTPGTGDVSCSGQDSPVILSAQQTGIPDGDAAERTTAGAGVLTPQASGQTPKPPLPPAAAAAGSSSASLGVPARASGSASTQAPISKAMLLALHLAKTPLSVREEQQAAEAAEAAAAEKAKREAEEAEKKEAEKAAAAAAVKADTGGSPGSAKAAAIPIPSGGGSGRVGAQGKAGRAQGVAAPASVMSLGSTVVSGVDDAVSPLPGELATNNRAAIDEWVTVDVTASGTSPLNQNPTAALAPAGGSAPQLAKQESSPFSSGLLSPLPSLPSLPSLPTLPSGTQGPSSTATLPTTARDGLTLAPLPPPRASASASPFQTMSMPPAPSLSEGLPGFARSSMAVSSYSPQHGPGVTLPSLGPTLNPVAPLLLQPLDRESHLIGGSMNVGPYAADGGMARMSMTQALPVAPSKVEEVCRREGVSRLLERVQALLLQVECDRDLSGESATSKSLKGASKAMKELQAVVAALLRAQSAGGGAAGAGASTRSDPGGGGAVVEGAGAALGARGAAASSLSSDLSGGGSEPTSPRPPPAATTTTDSSSTGGDAAASGAPRSPSGGDGGVGVGASALAKLKFVVDALGSNLEDLVVQSSVDAGVMQGYQEVVADLSDKVQEIARSLAERDAMVDAVKLKLAHQMRMLVTKEEELEERDAQIAQLQDQLAAAHAQLAAARGERQGSVSRASAGVASKLFGAGGSNSRGSSPGREGGERGGGSGLWKEWQQEESKVAKASNWIKSKWLKSREDVGAAVGNGGGD